MAAITDGTYTSPVQDGDKQVVFPFDFLGDAYARMITRPYVMLSSSYTAPRTLTTTSVTNYLQRSESFDNAYWTASAVTVTADNAANPNNGALTADKLMETAATSGHNVVVAVTLSATPTTVSVFAKANGRDWLEIATVDSAATVKRSFFDLTNGVVGTTSSNTTSAIVSVGNGWYRVSQTWTSPAAGLGQIYFELSTNGSTVSYLGDVTKGVYLWGAQWENSSSLGTYLPTTSATRTSSLRTRDIVDNSGDSGADYFAFLCQETPPDAGSLRQGIARLSRTYMRVPAQQIDYGSAIISRPVLDDIKSGTTYAVSWDDRFSWVFNSRKTVSSFGTPDAPAAGGPLATEKSLPSVTVTIGKTAGGTTTFSTTDSGSSIQSTLAAAFGSAVYVAKSDTEITATGTSLASTVKYVDVSGTGVAASFSDDGTRGDLRISVMAQNAASIRTVSATAHGGVAGDRVAFWNADKLIAKGVVITAATDSFTVELSEVPGKDFTATHCGFSTDATACYVNGPVSVSTKIVTDFYYPGWSPGISTPADISVVSTQLDPISWLGLIVAGTAYGAIETGNVEKYQGGPFYSYTATYAQMSDALDTVTP